jgi:hypothetical protein
MNMQEYREGNTVWLATLSNGEQVCRNDAGGVNSWFQLRDRLSREKLHIVNFSLAFRSNHVHLPPNKDGYLFSLGVLASISNNKNIMLAGYMDGDNVIVTEYVVPELIEWDTFCTNKEKCRTLIINPSLEQNVKLDHQHILPN